MPQLDLSRRFKPLIKKQPLKKKPRSPTSSLVCVVQGVLLKTRYTRAGQTFEVPVLLSAHYQDWRMVSERAREPDSGFRGLGCRGLGFQGSKQLGVSGVHAGLTAITLWFRFCLLLLTIMVFGLAGCFGGWVCDCCRCLFFARRPHH